MLPLGFFLVLVGAATFLVGLFSTNGHLFGWALTTHTAFLIGAGAALVILAGARLIQWGAVRGVKNAIAQRKFDKQARRERNEHESD